MSVTNVDEHAVCENISTNKTLDMLALKQRSQDGRFYQHVIRKQAPDNVFVARDIRGRWCIDMGDSYRIQAKPSRQPLSNNGTGRAGVNHGYGWDGCRKGGPGFSESQLYGGTNSDTTFNDGTNRLEVGE